MSQMPACRWGGAAAAAAAPEGQAVWACCCWPAAGAATQQQKQLLRAPPSPGSAQMRRGWTAGRAAHSGRAGLHLPAAGPAAVAGGQQGGGVPPLAAWPATARVAARTGAYITALGLAVFVAPGPRFGAVCDAR